jgi:hypothetical protein
MDSAGMFENRPTVRNASVTVVAGWPMDLPEGQILNGVELVEHRVYFMMNGACSAVLTTRAGRTLKLQPSAAKE